MAQSKKNKQSGKEGDAQLARRNWNAPVGQDSRALAASAFARKGFADPTLVLRWSEIAGPEVARLAVPVKLSDSTLTLKAEPGASLFLQHETRALCERINTYLGRQAVTRLRFTQGPLAPPRPRGRSLPHPGGVKTGDPAQTFAGPEGLRAALLALARWRH